MMGRLERGQSRFFYDFCLDEVVPTDHLVRKIDAVLDLSWLHGELEGYYSHTGRPSIDPELMMRMLIIGYVFAIRSERQLCSEVQVNLAYRWFCGLGIEDTVPDHSVFSRARHERFLEGDAYRLVFEHVVQTCMASGLVGGTSLSVDASLIKADVNQVKRVAGDTAIDWPDREQATRAVAEYLSALDRDAPEQRKPPKAISLTDPQAAWVAKNKMRPFFAYDANYLIDNKLGVIVDAEGCRANRVEENRVAVAMVKRVMTRFDLKPKRLAADTAYGTGRTLKSLMDCGIEPHIPVWDKSKRKDGTFSRAEFSYDMQHNVYTCPRGKTLKTTGKVYSGHTLIYRARKVDCDPCPLKQKCCPNTPQRKIPRNINESVRDHVRALANTKAFDQSRRERNKVEMAFAHLKRILKLDHLRLRGLAKPQNKCL
jgi:transposase